MSITSSNLGEKIEKIVIPLLSSRKTETGRQSGVPQRPRLEISSINISGDGRLTIRFSRPILRDKIETMLKRRRLFARDHDPIE